MKNDGGCAFPAQLLGSDGLPRHEGDPGMSLRDWFAGMALCDLAGIDGGTSNDVAKAAYEIADALIAERDK